MRYALPLLALLFPVSAFAAPSVYTFDQDLVIASSSPGNAYFAGATVAVTGPVSGDLMLVAGNASLASPVSGDGLLAAGGLKISGSITGDLRILAGSTHLAAPVSGDLVAVSGYFEDTSGGAKSVLVIAGNATLAGGAGGPVTVYANNVVLGGDFKSDVRVVAAGRVALREGTTIHGALEYRSPAEALIPTSAVITGGAHYSGPSFLPSSAMARALAFISVGIFLLVEVFGALILAGLLAGLFPRLAERLAEAAFTATTRRAVLTTLLGFAVMVATPVLLVLLALTFVGFGLAVLLGVSYILLIILSFVYAGILIGAGLARRVAKRTTVLWRDGVVGMLLLSILTMVPLLGWTIIFLLMAFAAGALMRVFYRSAFPREVETDVLL